MSLLTLRGVRKSFGPTEIIRGVDLELRADERHALIGPNGAGKSTVFHLVSGHLAPSAGEIVFDGERIDGQSPQAINRRGLARSFQITNIFPKLSVFENLRLAVMRQYGLQYNLWKIIGRDAGVREATERLLEQVRLQRREAGRVVEPAVQGDHPRPPLALEAKTRQLTPGGRNGDLARIHPSRPAAQTARRARASACAGASLRQGM